MMESGSSSPSASAADAATAATLSTLADRVYVVAESAIAGGAGAAAIVLIVIGSVGLSVAGRRGAARPEPELLSSRSPVANFVETIDVLMKLCDTYDSWNHPWNMSRNLVVYGHYTR